MLKLISWNIQSARTASGGADPAAVVAALDRFSTFDILCLQEVARGGKARDGSVLGDQFAALAACLPGYHGVGCVALDLPAAAPGGVRLGSMVLSRHPVLQVLRHSLPWPCDATVSGMPRCALELTLDTPLGPLRVVTVHLEYFSVGQRRAQVGQLRALQRDAVLHPLRPRDQAGAPRALPAVFAGDYNMLPDSAEYNLLAVPYTDGTPALRDAWRLAHPGSPHAPTVGLHDRSPDAAAPYTFDFAFVSADLAPRVRGLRVADAALGSDHQPLLLELA